jgi:hypothetical protein
MKNKKLIFTVMGYFFALMAVLSAIWFSNEPSMLPMLSLAICMLMLSIPIAVQATSYDEVRFWFKVGGQNIPPPPISLFAVAMIIGGGPFLIGIIKLLFLKQATFWLLGLIVLLLHSLIEAKLKITETWHKKYLDSKETSPV